uniref:cellulose 1,4-beta-cellobiosidase (non-reducing end) n=1 Tax=uncultured symbiotic protist of Hodotermopsis sjoestedti TaxID=403659 RepID=A4UWT4_9EUKA|nr:putative glycosyl hydrolase family7 [uncultured symbiotic protist of Hodotermopsis sjoestedti]
MIGIVLIQTVFGIGVGTQQSESHPSLSWQQCSKGGSCTSVSGSIVLDSNWRWTHIPDGTTNCYDGNEWSSDLCPDPTTCSNNCVLEGADYSGTYGISTSGSSAKLGFVTKGSYSTNIGSRVYLLGDESHYKIFDLKNKEFTFTVDDSNLECGLNGALYFVAMDEDGGASRFTLAKPGAKYGTGYCDAQCPHDIKFINGEANVQDWKPSDNDDNAGTGHYGACCTEMDIWEANKYATAYTPHICTENGEYRCEGKSCGDSSDDRYGGVCDKDGCDFNSWRLGNQSFWGPGLIIDTGKPVTVVTQFVTKDGTDSGALSEIRRKYVQGGKTIENTVVKISGIDEVDSITDEFCNQQKQAFGDTNDFEKKGGLSGLGKAFDYGVVLVLSLWDDHDVNMLWLDSVYPTNPAGKAGADRGPCATSSGDPKEVEDKYASASVTFSDIKFGPIDSTY